MCEKHFWQFRGWETGDGITKEVVYFCAWCLEVTITKEML